MGLDLITMVFRVFSVVSIGLFGCFMICILVFQH